ncbi:MAG: RNA methyltransferase [Flavobacteriaceae bacterium]|nr:RNA methyltransferase [Flavobacteriaceae bacterium]
MVSKSQIKLITSLQQKKYRNKWGLFVAEGPKVINELLKAELSLHSIYVTENDLFEGLSAELVSEKEISKISFLKNANNSVAVFKIPEQKNISDKKMMVALDAIRDPGNLGTIIRLCDWFGIEQIICSEDTVDCYNPKVIQATMGSITRVKVEYLNLVKFISKTSIPVYVGVMDGENIYQQKLPKTAIIVLGNEANGISNEIINLASHKIAIPQFGVIQETESLNVATATAVLLSEFKRSIVR